MRVSIRIFCATLLFFFVVTNVVGSGLDDLKRHDKLPLFSNARTISSLKLGDIADDALINSAIIEFSRNQLKTETILDLFKYGADRVDQSSIDEIIDTSWIKGSETGDFSAYFRFVHFYGKSSEIDRAKSAFRQDPSVQGAEVIVSLGRAEDVSEVLEFLGDLEEQNEIDRDLSGVIRNRIRFRQAVGQVSYERLQRQALLEMSDGERNIFFLYEINPPEPIGWNAIIRGMEVYGSESARSLFERNIFTDADAQIYEGLFRRAFANEALVSRENELVPRESSDGTVDQHAGNVSAFSAPPQETSATSITIWTIGLLSIIGIVVILIKKKKWFK